MTSTEQLTQLQADSLLHWCRSHDWGRFSFVHDGRILGLRDDERVLTSFPLTPAGVRELRAWAGY